MFEDGCTCSIVVRKLCGCIEDRKEFHDYEMRGLQENIEVTIIFHRLQRGVTHEVEVLSTRIGTRIVRIHF
jgi:hypothetical protein